MGTRCYHCDKPIKPSQPSIRLAWLYGLWVHAYCYYFLWRNENNLNPNQHLLTPADR